MDNYNCIIGIMVETDPEVSSSGLSSFDKSCLYDVSFVTNDDYLDTLSTMDASGFMNAGGSSLGAIFIPFHSISGIDNAGGNLPCFSVDIPISEGSGINFPNIHNLLPFKWNTSGVNILKNREDESDGDNYPSIVSSNAYVNDIEKFRDQHDMRGIGLRSPMIVVGWGYTLDDLPCPSGSGNNMFAGEVEHGYQVHPSKYIAAPLDLRYDTDRGVWVSARERKHRHLKNTNADGGPAFAGFFR